MNKIAFLFPGQGSQYTGMGRDLFEHHAEVRALFEEASETTAMNMTDICFKSPDEVLKRTQNAQPAVCLVNAACLCVLKQEGIAPHALAGHSLGEYTALYAAGAMAFGTMMDLVRKRALFMQEAAGQGRMLFRHVGFNAREGIAPLALFLDEALSRPVVGSR